MKEINADAWHGTLDLLIWSEIQRSIAGSVRLCQDRRSPLLYLLTTISISTEIKDVRHRARLEFDFCFETVLQ